MGAIPTTQSLYHGVLDPRLGCRRCRANPKAVPRKLLRWVARRFDDVSNPGDELILKQGLPLRAMNSGPAVLPRTAK